MHQFENPFLFYLIDPDTGQYWTMVAGVPTLTSTPTYLTDFYFGNPQAPEGWRDIKFSWARSDMYWGLYRNMSTNFVFYGQSAEILTYLFFTFGSTAKCILQIRKWDYANTGASVSLNVFYECTLDFVKCNPLQRGAVEIPCKEMGLRDLFTQNERVVYEIPITGAGSVLCSMYGFKLKGQMKFVGASFGNLEFDNVAVYVGLAESSSDGDFDIGDSQAVIPGLTGSPDPNNWFFKSSLTQTLDVTVTGTFDMSWKPLNGSTPILDPATLNIEMNVYDNDSTTTPIASFVIVSAVQDFGDGVLTYTVAQTFNMTVNEGNVIRILAFATYSGAGYSNNPFGFTTYPNIRVNIASVFTLPLTQTLAFTEAAVLNKVVEAMTAGAYPADDTFLATNTDYVNSSPALTVYASGDAIRNISAVTGVPDVLKITAGDFFENIMNDYGGGIGIENDTVIFRKKEYFLDPSFEIMDIGEVSGFSAPVAEELINNYIQVGCTEQEYDGYNGKDEFMNTFRWKTAITHPQTLDLVRKFRYDPDGIETTRYTLLDKDTTDNKGDNDIYVWEIDNTTIVNGGYAPRRFPIPPDSITGVLFPESKYNIGKSPLMQFWRNAPQVKGILSYNLSDTITFQSTQKNAELASNISGIDYIEKADIVPNTNFGSETPLFIPNWLKFNCPLGADIITALNATPNGYIRFSVDGVSLMGFPWNVEVNGLRTEENEVKLLCHPDVDPLDIREAVKRSYF